MTIEKWRMVDGYEGRYAVSNAGRVKRTIEYTTADGRSFKWRGEYLKLSKDKRGKGYWRVWLYDRKKRRSCPLSVHGLVARYFIGPCPPDKEINHKDGDPSNNNVDNLEWVTHRENIQHSFRELDHAANLVRGSEHHHAKLHERDIPHIRTLLSQGYSKASIGRLYGVSGYAINCIANGKTWKHVPTQLSLLEK